MKTKRILFLILAFIFVTLNRALADEPLSNESLAKLASNLTNFSRVTVKPVAMHPNVAADCVPPFQDHSALVTNQQAVFHVYVTPDGVAAMKKPEASFPSGTVILKQKFASPTSRATELYTGMLKREKNYNPDCGDWEFFTLSGDAKKVTARGKIESCMDCHKRYSHSDYVTKNYQ